MINITIEFLCIMIIWFSSGFNVLCCTDDIFMHYKKLYLFNKTTKNNLCNVFAFICIILHISIRATARTTILT
jgi:hypothetical protein